MLILTYKLMMGLGLPAVHSVNLSRYYDNFLTFFQK